MQSVFRWSIFLSSAIFLATGELSAQTIQVNPNNRTIAITVSDKAAADPDAATVLRFLPPHRTRLMRQGRGFPTAL
jgi:hypothetical protein